MESRMTIDEGIDFVKEQESRALKNLDSRKAAMHACEKRLNIPGTEWELAERLEWELMGFMEGVKEADELARSFGQIGDYLKDYKEMVARGMDDGK